MTDFSQYAPVSKAEAAAASGSPAPPPPPPAAPPAPPPVFLDGVARSLRVPLAHPLAYAGQEYRAITVRRPTAAEVGRYFERLRALTAEQVLHFPVFADDAGKAVPDEVMDGLDDDDYASLLAVVTDFLPRRLRVLSEPVPTASSPAPGAATAPTSST